MWCSLLLLMAILLDLIGSCAYIQISWAGVYKHMLDYKNICSQKYSSVHVILSHASSCTINIPSYA